jgi:hypothetical protein
MTTEYNTTPIGQSMIGCGMMIVILTAMMIPISFIVYLVRWIIQILS